MSAGFLGVWRGLLSAPTCKLNLKPDPQQQLLKNADGSPLGKDWEIDRFLPAVLCTEP